MIATSPITNPGRLGPFKTLACAYTGEFSEVYRCRDVGLLREVAVKRARGGRPAAAEHRRLRREAQIRSEFDHPHLLPVYRLVRAAGGLLVVGPWLSGGSLKDRLRHQPLHLAETLALADGIGIALDALHAAGWWHGDVSAGNVLFTADGRAVLADFGAARRIGSRLVSGELLTVTPAVTAPEVLSGGAVDGASDRYSLGVLLYAALTGGYPFDAPTDVALLALHRDAPVPTPSERTPTVGAATERVLLRALAKDATSRFASGGDLAHALRSALYSDGLLDANPARPAVLVPRTDDGAHRYAEPFDDSAIVGAGVHLDRFAATLDARGQAALRAMFQRARASDAHAAAAIGQLTMQHLAPAAALLTLEEVGLADVLAEEPLTAIEAAAKCAMPVGTVSQVLDLLTALSVLDREDDRFRLPEPVAGLYRAYRRIGARARPIQGAARYWGHLPRWAATGEPFMQMDRPDGSVYVGITGLLGARFVGAARALASHLRHQGYVQPGAVLLDVGAGSGVWSLELAGLDATTMVTALDREQVLETTRIYADAAGLRQRLHTLVGDWRNAPIPAAAFDVAFAANICHLESGIGVAGLVKRLAAALRPGGRLVIVDTIPTRRADADAGELLQSLHLALRTTGGGVHSLESYSDWLRDAGFLIEEQVPLNAPQARLTALIARRA